MLFSLAAAAQDFKITHGPYLCDMTQDGVTVVWTTSKPALSWVEVAPDDGRSFYAQEHTRYYQTVAGRKLADRTLHAVRIKGLKPGTDYCYRIFSQEVTAWPQRGKASYGRVAASDVFRRKPYPFRTFPDSGADCSFIVFNDIHAVPIVRKSFLLEDDPHRSDSIGHDLIRVVTAAFSGNYINIGFEYFRYENGQPHMINLVWDDTRPATDSVYLELRHNAMGEVEGNGRYVVSDTGLASFRIADLVPEGEESIDIKLKSNMDRKDGVGEYIETEKYHTGTYTTGSTAKTYIVGGELYPPENHTAFVRN